MSTVRVAFPILRGRRRFHVEKGQRWSLVEHLMLDAVAKQPASAVELARRSNLPRRVVVEAFIRLMRVGWVELAPATQGLIFCATTTGRTQIGAGDLQAPTVTQPRWMAFIWDQVTGSVFRRTEITARHPNDLTQESSDTLVYLSATDRYSREDIADVFDALEGEDEVIVRVDPSHERMVERFAVVTVTDAVIEGLPGRAKPELREAILARAAEATKKMKAPAEARATTHPQSLPSLQPTPALFDQSDLIIDGPEHKEAFENSLRNARDQVIIHSTFISEDSFPSILPVLIGAAARGVTIHILWGQNDEAPNTSDTRAAAATLRAAVTEAGRSENIIVHSVTTRSHAKVLVADDGRDRWTAIVGSCNWLCSDFKSFEASIRLCDPILVAETIRQLAALSLGPPGVWHTVAKELAVLGRHVACQPRGSGRQATMQLLLSPDHGALALEARDSARKRIFLTSHRIGLAGRPMVIIPAVAAAKASQVEAHLYYGRPTGAVSGLDAAQLASEFARQGVAIKPVNHPRLHAKILAWDDDALAVTSQNWLSADPAEGALRREIGVYVQSNKVADYVIRRFEHSRSTSHS